MHARKRLITLNAAEAGGTRVKPEYASVWLDMNETDLEHARIHSTVAVPGATGKSTGFPEAPSAGRAWIMGPGTSSAHIMTPGS